MRAGEFTLLSLLGTLPDGLATLESNYAMRKVVGSYLDLYCEANATVAASLYPGLSQLGGSELNSRLTNWTVNAAVLLASD